jgi:cell wall-associated NlpC family hydrolase
MIPAWVARYVGLPFKSLGRERDGVDCWGLVHLVYREQLGREVPSYSADYADAFDLEEVAALVRGEMISRWREVPRGAERIGDVILLRLRGQPSHTGIVVDTEAAGRWFLHARERVHSCLERYDTMRWEKRVLGFYRYAG